MEFGNVLDQLEKLNELKEKDILTQEEFDKKKQELLSCQSSSVSKNEKTTSVSNIVASLIITLFVLFGMITVAYANGVSIGILVIISAIVYSIISANLNTKKYDAWYCQHPLGVFVGTMILWLIAFPIYTYAFLQIKEKNVPLKTDEKTAEQK